jgi:His-Xaa-Ser system protein HxsD
MTTAQTPVQEMVELSYALDERSVTFTVDETLYPIDAIYGAAYLFIDRCFVFLSRAGDRQVTVRLRAREETTLEFLDRLAGEFANELLNQVLRFRLAASTEKIREYYTARAFFSDPVPKSIDALLAELDAEELGADNLDVKLPWQES